ncbi:MAG: hypothetical protein K2X66_15355, partial [Cyanobacteria bacterium]|nr:hypothetical protein [Cyanobacteriota bacterium]
LLKSGVLTDNFADDNHTTIYHLYSILKTPRARGVSAENVLNETVRILNKPYQITQKFPSLSENSIKQILQVRNNPSLNRAGEPAPPKPLTRSDLNVTYSSDCVPSSVMFYMADKNPSELARHLSELTSPMEAFYEKVKLSEICPDKPSEAIDVLKYYDIPFVKTSEDELIVRVDLPVAGKLRMINDSTKKGAHGARSGIETAYQSALAYLPTRSYDPATGQRDAMESTIATIYQLKSLPDPDKQKLMEILQSSKSPAKTQKAFLEAFNEISYKLTTNERTQVHNALQAQSKGLTEMEKTLLETIIKDNGGVSSITYQVVSGKAKPNPGEESSSYLYGYTRSFEQTTADMIESLKMGEFVIIGITDTDSSGTIVGGHEITLTGAFVDKKDGEIKFEVVDSDDDIPTPVIRSARELIPRIHHAGMPNQLAKKINQDMESTKGYFVPSKEDYAAYTPLQMLNEPLPEDPQPQEMEPVKNAEPLQTPGKKFQDVSPEPTPKPSSSVKNVVSIPPSPVRPDDINASGLNPGWGVSYPIQPQVYAPYYYGPGYQTYQQPYYQQPVAPAQYPLNGFYGYGAMPYGSYSPINPSSGYPNQAFVQAPVYNNPMNVGPWSVYNRVAS